MIFVWLFFCIAIPFLLSYLLGVLLGGNKKYWNSDVREIVSLAYFLLQAVGIWLFFKMFVKLGYL